MSLSIALLSLFLLTPAPNAAPKKTCTLRSTHGTPVLLGDAWSQTIAVVTDSCDKLEKSDYLLVNSADSKLRAPVAYDGTNLAMTAPIPAPGDAGSAVSSTWLLYPSEGAMSSGAPSLGQVIMTPVTVKVSSRTVVHYPDDPMLTETLARARKPAGIAYANRTFEEEQKDKTKKIINTVINTAQLDFADVGPVQTWTVTSLTDATLLTTDENACSPKPCGTNNPQRIQFTAARAAPATQWANLSGYRAGGDVFELRVKLADSVEPSSVPIDISDLAYIRCQKAAKMGTFDIIENTDLAAITNGTATNNRCMLIVSEQDIASSIARKHGITHTRHICPPQGRDATSRTQIDRLNTLNAKVAMGVQDTSDSSIAAECKKLDANEGEEITVIDQTGETKLNRLKELYGEQRVTYFVYADPAKKEASRRELVFSASLAGRIEIPLKLDGEAPSPDKPYRIEAYVQPVTAPEELPADLDRLPRLQFNSTLRPKGPFGITHRKNSLGSRSWRIFATIPFQFATVRFPAAGLDIKSTRDSTIAQLATLTTGLLVTAEPWDYTRGTNRYALPWRVQGGLLLSNWTKGVFHPSTYVGAAITLPVFRGTSQLDTDLALGLGWEVDLRPGFDSFGPRNHLLLTLGMNLLSLFGPQSAPRNK